jgi:hypothetical protein
MEGEILGQNAPESVLHPFAGLVGNRAGELADFLLSLI